MAEEINAPDPFSPESLRLSQDFTGETCVKKHLVKVPVRKPGKQEWFRARSSPNYRVDTAVLELGEEREHYLVLPSMRDVLALEIKPVRLFTCINRQNTIFLWPCRLPDPDGRRCDWHETALECASLAIGKWVRVVADMSLSAYQPYVAEGTLPEPDWPDYTFRQLLEKAFAQRVIDDPDHPVVARLRGRT